MRIKGEYIGLFSLVVACIFLLIRGGNEKRNLKNRGVYVVGELKEVSLGSDNGWVYKYEYSYLKRKYIKKFQGPIDKAIVSDSILFFIVLPEDPSICRQVDNIKVPPCLKGISFKDSSWKNLPLDICVDKNK
ncbi:MAG: hypothetical protein P0Y53_17450 [Candidatus Pseudobacter hemicellulosilyticus]|uniref:Uncharacterized protein n=1 Tax=Candidatus Pseudobacter hemicellulosilyticus TaxID=3121375 RepID=A0AAJ5WTN9_9BACT|nr:MAG: hypothetical protein P0Y53_17450 [Pseudobacter sp.]